jgi:hypothetical protein
MNDREILLDRLKAGREELLAAVEGLTDAQAKATPGCGGWSALGCVEHVATVEARLLRRMQTETTVLDEEMSREREAILYDSIVSRGKKVQAPELVHPTGRYPDLDAAIQEFVAARERTMQWVAECDWDLRRRSVAHPAFGVISAYEMVLIGAAHAARHARQITEGRQSSVTHGSVTDGSVTYDKET